MINRWLCLIFITLIFFSSVQAAEVVVLDPETPFPSGIDVSNETNQNYLNLISRVASLENAVASKVSQEDFEKGINFTVDTLSQVFDEKTNVLILGFLMGQLFTLGLAFGVFFYLKGQRKI